ncbi:hypothetical protein NDU88_003562 [Pleurodeles waltl]|uniref:Uncharacterized protein n=1 Tax=Pleurodeles waltl TaxID=8319 RepID=A0AAV7RFN6_PLEWA|nr:hypothetical protein NDU88_003562 [Pleurodeles waltl]
MNVLDVQAPCGGIREPWSGVCGPSGVAGWCGAALELQKSRSMAARVRFRGRSGRICTGAGKAAEVSGRPVKGGKAEKRIVEMTRGDESAVRCVGTQRPDHNCMDGVLTGSYRYVFAFFVQCIPRPVLSNRPLKYISAFYNRRLANDHMRETAETRCLLYCRPQKRKEQTH